MAAASREAPNPVGSAATPTWLAGWSGRRVILTSTFGVAIGVFLWFSPRFWLWPAAGLPLSEFTAIQPEFHRAFHALRQLADPWQRIDDPVNRVIEWRLLFPLLGHFLSLPKGLYLALPHLGCVLALATVAGVAWRSTRAALPTFAATLLAATSSWFFVSTGWLAYFDAWLMLALLLASFGRSRGILFAAALLAPWIDERFILALPICLVARALGADRETPPDRRSLGRDALILFAGIVPYVAVRLGAELSAVRATGQSYWADRPLIPAPWHGLLWGAWNGLRAGWVALALAAVIAFQTRRHRLLVAVAGLTLALNLIVADDLSRSASVGVPLVVATLLLGWRHRPARTQRALPWICAANLVLPAQHVIAAPGTAVRFHCVPILSVHAEYERTQNPPDFANPATYNRRAMDHFQNRSTERALAAVDIALAFDPGFAPALASRGILLHVMGRREEGLALLDQALKRAPELYDARMQRAAFRQQAGNLAGALDDVRAALRFIPADWPRRNDALQFERNLAAQVGK